MNTRKPIFLSFLVILVILFQLVTPGVARAQEETPPPETPATEVPVTEEPVTEEPVAPESLPEVLAQAPEGTEVVVLNEEGETEPLATAEAAAIIDNGQAIWCPAGTLPSDANADAVCTSAHDSLEGLVAGLSAYAGSGTIYIGIDYAVDPAAASTLSLNNHAASLDGLAALVVQGGWDYVVGEAVGNTLFAGQSLSFTWYNDLTINNLTIVTDPGAAYGLQVTTDDNAANQTSSLTLNNIDISVASGGPEVSTPTTTVGLDVAAQGYEYGGGDVEITNVSVSGFDVGARVETDFGGNIAITNGYFVDNGVGLVADTTGESLFSEAAPFLLPECHPGPPGDIVLTNIFASYNSVQGAVLFSANDASVTNGSFFGNGFVEPGSGLELTAEGAVSLTGVTANGNSLYGLVAVAGEGMTLENITTSNNQFGTALVSAPGTDITLTNGTFTYNDIGLFVSNAGGPLPEAYAPECEPETGTITLTNIFASYNREQGAILKSAGEVTLTNTDFSYNGSGSGLTVFMTTPGTVSVYNMRAAGNAGNGMDVWAGLSSPETYGGGTPRPKVEYDVMIVCAAFFDNGGYGFYLDGHDAQSGVGFNTNYFAGNETAPYYVGDAAFLEENLLDCFVVVVPPDAPLKTVRVVPVSGGTQPVLLDCARYSGTILVLPNGDKVTYYCPANGTVTTGSVAAGELPGDLDAGLTYVSALETSLDDGGPVTILPDGRLRVSFAVPEGADADSLAILYWDPALNGGAGAWVELPAAAWNTALYDPSDGKMVFVGPYLNPEDEFETIVNFTGTFVLVQK